MERTVQNVEECKNESIHFPFVLPIIILFKYIETINGMSNIKKTKINKFVMVEVGKYFVFEDLFQPKLVN